MKKIYKIPIITTLSLISFYFGGLLYLKAEPSLDITIKDINMEENNFGIIETKGINILTLKGGTSYQKGYFHGKELEKEIKELLSYFQKNMLGRDHYLGGPIYSSLQYKAKKFIPYISKEILEEIKGISDGAGVSFNEVLLINTYDDLLQIAGCSSMSIPKKELFNDYFIHTRNLDYPIKILARNKVVIKYDSHISIGFPGYIGVLTGIGEKGISLSTHTAYSENKAGYGTPSGLLYRKIIQNAGTIEESKEILKNEKRTIANNLMIGSYKENTSVIAELDSKEIDFRDVFEKNILVSTNHYRTNKMKQLSTNEEGTRYKQYFEKINELDKIELKNIKEILSYYKKSNFWKTIANDGTVQSVIMIPELRKIYIANGKEIPVTNGEYVEINY